MNERSIRIWKQILTGVRAAGVHVAQHSNFAVIEFGRKY
jgi:hypothetical protein